jgi:hypothetical protein
MPTTFANLRGIAHGGSGGMRTVFPGRVEDAVAGRAHSHPLSERGEVGRHLERPCHRKCDGNMPMVNGRPTAPRPRRGRHRRRRRRQQHHQGRLRVHDALVGRSRPDPGAARGVPEGPDPHVRGGAPAREARGRVALGAFPRADHRARRAGRCGFWAR